MSVAFAILSRIWPYLLGLALLLGAYSWAHHNGAVAQAAKDGKAIAALNAEVAADKVSLTGWAKAGEQWHAAQAAQAAAQAAQAKQAATALAEYQKNAQARERGLQAALTAQRAAYRADKCAAQPLPDGVR